MSSVRLEQQQTANGQFVQHSPPSPGRELRARIVREPCRAAPKVLVSGCLWYVHRHQGMSAPHSQPLQISRSPAPAHPWLLVRTRRAGSGKRASTNVYDFFSRSSTQLRSAETETLPLMLSLATAAIEVIKI